MRTVILQFVIHKSPYLLSDPTPVIIAILLEFCLPHMKFDFIVF